MTTRPDAAPRLERLLSLQVLRAAAALLVLVHHAGYDADAIARGAGSAPFALDRYADLGFGVHLFFVISGFVMLRTARGFGTARGARVFAVRRVLRVAPLYWLMTSLALLGGAIAPSLLNTPPGGAAWVAGSYMFVPVARPDGAINPVLGQGWTLDYEMFFYALFAAALPLPRRAAVPALVAALVGLALVGRLAPPAGAALRVWTDGLLLEFGFGLLIAVVTERGPRLPAAAAAALALAGAALFVLTGPATGALGALPPWLGEGGPAALIVAGCVLGPRWPANRAVLALALVGDASYSLYLSHPFAVRSLRAAWTAAVPGAPPALYLAVSCAAAIAASLALHRWVERPMTEALGRRFRHAAGGARPVLPEAAEAARRA